MGQLVAKLVALCAAVAPRSTKSKRAKRRGEFDWRVENPAALRRSNCLPIEAFVRHLSALNLNEGITRPELIGIYYEWVEANEARPITGWQRWDRALRTCGMKNRRSSLPGRPRLYYAPVALPAPARAKAAPTSKDQGREAA